MEISVEIICAGSFGPPAGAPVIVQVRDAGLQDEAATTIAEKRATSRASGPGEPFARVQMSVETSGGYPIVWVHVDVDESGDVSQGDFITMQSYPVREGGTMRVEVRQVT